MVKDWVAVGRRVVRLARRGKVPGRGLTRAMTVIQGRLSPAQWREVIGAAGPEDKAERQGRCPRCGQVFRVV